MLSEVLQMLQCHCTVSNLIFIKFQLLEGELQDCYTCITKAHFPGECGLLAVPALVSLRIAFCLLAFFQVKAKSFHPLCLFNMNTILY